MISPQTARFEGKSNSVGAYIAADLPFPRQHTLPKVQLELSKIQLAEAPTVKRPLSEYNQLQKALAVANKKIRKEKMRGSDGARCDGCGLDADSGEDDVDVICERCLYTACGSCEVHHSRGACYCKKGW